MKAQYPCLEFRAFFIDNQSLPEASSFRHGEGVDVRLKFAKVSGAVPVQSNSAH